jgi:hypothetical protein
MKEHRILIDEIRQWSVSISEFLLGRRARGSPSEQGINESIRHTCEDLQESHRLLLVSDPQSLLLILAQGKLSAMSSEREQDKLTINGLREDVRSIRQQNNDTNVKLDRILAMMRSSQNLIIADDTTTKQNQKKRKIDEQDRETSTAEVAAAAPQCTSVTPFGLTALRAVPKKEYQSLDSITIDSVIRDWFKCQLFNRDNFVNTKTDTSGKITRLVNAALKWADRSDLAILEKIPSTDQTDYLAYSEIWEQTVVRVANSFINQLKVKENNDPSLKTPKRSNDKVRSVTSLVKRLGIVLKKAE